MTAEPVDRLPSRHDETVAVSTLRRPWPATKPHDHDLTPTIVLPHQLLGLWTV